MLAPVNRNPDRRTIRQFGWSMILGFGVLAMALWFLRVPPSLRWHWAGQSTQIVCAVLAGVGLMIGVMAFLWPTAGRWFYVAWMSATRLMGIAVFFIGLSIAFLIVLPVFSLIIRRMDPLRRRLHPDRTYWEDATPIEHTLERMRRPF